MQSQVINVCNSIFKGHRHSKLNQFQRNMFTRLVHEERTLILQEKNPLDDISVPKYQSRFEALSVNNS
jgi:hypothetical protein